jgi:hypothetical protein
MAQPNVKEELIAGPLPGVSIAYRNLEYIGDRVFNIVDGSDPKAKITKYQRGAWFRNEAGIRAAGTRARRGGYPITSVSMSTNEYAFAKEVTDEDRKFAKTKNAPVLQPDQDAVEFAADKIDLEKEIRIAQTIKDTTWVDDNAAGEDAEGKWVASSGNTFLADITTGKKAIKNAAGVIPNVLLIDYATYLGLKEVDDILQKIKYTQRAIFGKELLASLLELEEVLVGMAIYSSAKETKAGTDFTAVDIWEVNAGKGMGFLFYRPPRIGLKVRCAGLQARIEYESGNIRRVSKWREEAEHQDVYEVAEETDIVVVDAYCGYKWCDVYAT